MNLMPREIKQLSLKMTQVKEIQSISNTNRMVKALLQAHEVGGAILCMSKGSKAQKRRNYQHYTCRHAGLNEHKLMTWAPALKIYENYETKVLLGKKN